MRFKSVFIYFLPFIYFEIRVYAMIEGLYCGVQNCYDVLGVKREATKNEIAKAYRLLARKYHPDLHRKTEDKIVVEEKFKEIANAYEILKEEESRTDYDYMLDHPEEVYSHYYRYYRRRVTPKVDVRIVIIVTLIVITIIQYFTSWQRYDTALNYLMTLPKYRNKALEIALEQGIIDDPRKKVKGKSKMDVKEETDKAIKSILESNVDIRGGYAKPELTDLLILQLALLPYKIVMYLKWFISWTWRFDIMKEEYGDEEKLYLIRKNMKLSEYQFDGLKESEKIQFLKGELWIKEKFEKWQKEKNEEMKKQMAENARYKAYRRYIKNHGPGRMIFDDS